ncbi:homocysteine S-methyltransferase [Acrasis kona]|uniref:Homocysteine S-methyltransferase n=1 Tax=Acrasis kona TaxID=1008807 RepID=A0AAW2ZK55_9EUKA
MKQSKLSVLLNKNVKLVLDGAMATELQSRGHSLDTKLWSFPMVHDHPNSVRDVHMDYMNVGSDIITACTYQSDLKPEDKQTEQMMFDAMKIIHLAKQQYCTNQSNGREVLIAASMSSFGANMDGAQEYDGRYVDEVDDETISSFHGRKIRYLLEKCGDYAPDILLFETIPSLKEAQIIQDVLSKLDLINKTKQPDVLISFSCKEEQGIVTTCYGDKIEECIAFANASQIVQGVGVNCSTPDHTLQALRIARPLTTKLLVSYPNNGDVYDGINKTWSHQNSVMSFGDVASSLFDAGADIVGGCCRTCPNDINQIYNTRNRFLNEKP